MADQTFAVSSGFYDAVNSDRTYSADDMNRPYKRLVSNGVFATPQGTKSTDLQVVAAGGMQIIVKAGEGIFADKWFENPAAINITVPNNTSTSPRIDSVIVQVDKRTSGRVGNIVYRTGTPSSNPSAPAINTTSNVIEYRIANVRVAAGAVSITGGVITDRRGSSDCPWITSLIYQVDTSTLYDQWAAAYEEYFETEKEMWDDWYTHLTEELDVSMTLVKRTNTVVTTSDTSEIEIGIPDFNTNTDLLEVYVNGLKAIEGVQYTVNDNTSISLTAPVNAGQVVSFVIFKSVIMGNDVDIMSLINALEDRIASIQGGNPTVVSSTSDMTDTDKIYILSTDSKWYYYSLSSSEWVIGGTYGGVPTDTTLTQSGMAADAKTVGDAINPMRTATSSDVGKALKAKTVTDGKVTEWEFGEIVADPEVVDQAVYDWLDDHPEATTTVQDGSLTEAKFSNALKLKTIKDYVTPEMYGAVGDGVTDDTTALQSAINNGNTVVLGNKTYKITDTIILRSNLTIEGLNRNLSKIVFYGSSDKELFISSTSGNTAHLKLKNFTIEDTAERSVFLIDIPNSYPMEINGCTIAGYSNATTQNYKGVRLYATSNSHSYLAKIINNRFTRCQLTMDSRVTDAYIAFNELWGQYCECALFVNGGSNMMITNNQIVGGRVYGGIRIENAINASINDNYFDGSINELDTKCGIYSENGLLRSCVVGNKFWNYRSFGIYAPNSVATTITGNVFDDCDFFNNAVPDVYIDNACAISYIGNVHRRSQYYDTETNTLKARTSEMKQPPITLKNRGNGYPGSVVSGNVCVFSNFYSNAVYTMPIVAQINGSSQFDYTP